jgi:hypothetical protein
LDFKTDDVYEFELLARTYTMEENGKKRVDLILNDITHSASRARNSASSTCRSLYLAKTSHELKNPLSSIIELVDTIEENAKKQNMEKEILKDINNIKNYCEKIKYFINNFNIFSMFLDKCKKCSKYPCSFCIKNEYCLKCNTCSYCENSNKTNINATDLTTSIVNLFNAENKILQAGYNIKLISSNHRLYALANEQYFKSIMFNLIYQIKINSLQTDNIKIFIDRILNERKIKIEVITESKMDLTDINMMRERVLKTIYMSNTEIFNRKFPIAIVVILCSKSNIKFEIEKINEGTKFILTLNELEMIDLENAKQCKFSI